MIYTSKRESGMIDFLFPSLPHLCHVTVAEPGTQTVRLTKLIQMTDKCLRNLVCV